MRMDVSAVHECLRKAGKILIESPESILSEKDSDKLDSIYISLNIIAGSESNMHLDIDKSYNVSEEV